MRRLSRQQQLHAEHHHVRRVPFEGFSGFDESEPCGRQLPADLPDVPYDRCLAACQFRPLNRELPADGSAHGAPATVYGLPRQQQLHHHGDGLRFVSPEGFSDYGESQSRGRELLADLPDVPHDVRLAARQFRPLNRELPAYGSAHGAAATVYGLPRQQQLQHHVDDLRFMSPDGLQQHDESQSRLGRVRTDLRTVPQHVGLAAGNV